MSFRKPDILPYDFTKIIGNKTKNPGILTTIISSLKEVSYARNTFWKSITNYTSISSTAGHIKLLTPTDCVKDRLAAYFYWNDRQSLEQAIMIAKSQKIDLENIRKWAQKEGELKKYTDFITALEK